MQPKIWTLLIYEVLIDNTLNRAAMFFSAIPTYRVLPYSMIKDIINQQIEIKLNDKISQNLQDTDQLEKLHSKFEIIVQFLKNLFMNLIVTRCLLKNCTKELQTLLCTSIQQVL